MALAPVLFAGRPSFSSYGVLTDSAFHMLGADFLIRHGQDYAHLDLRNSYGQYLNSYYNTSYPSGADTLFGGSAFLSGRAFDLGLPAVQRLHARDRRRPGMGARAAARTRRRAGRGGRVDRHGASARIRLRADRIGQGDHRAGNDPHAGRARRPARALAARASPGRRAVRAGGRRGHLGARGGVWRVGARGGARARRDRDPPGHGEAVGRAHASHCCCSRPGRSSRCSPRWVRGSTCRGRCEWRRTSHRRATRATCKNR